MYTLYLIPGACSLAVQIMLRELGQEFTLVNQQQAENFAMINPSNMVPTLVKDEIVLTEGAAIMLHLLRTHSSQLWPVDTKQQQQIIEDLMFANATIHPAYGRLFFAKQIIMDDSERQIFMNEAAKCINKLWQVVSLRLQQREGHGPFLGGLQPNVADILLAVYARWGAYFYVDISIPDNVHVMLERVMSRESFKAALDAEQALL
ncbi:hypothetical protein N474_23495 [Pseudoalteromonas luteoviolacea CPMOR-2]|uniref:Glutathione S-transferase n=1 Tax=Pseudoalteromonas luteoviolacea DSM 6061 TaxID=1365250 RepID=A0A166Z9W9_9GAMM|nr:glutathione S-transferase family protein [Pseudoalteromonas luteoviolacea]KZN44094.1 hypothetical protein N475_08270 [Pseudoalteromonas luteoviolacea DSM 6061]KZN52183.1 hypothetical protein N474_23495 [Pseudoalteromonas luteoviolacea CPMOR-2]MBE0386207.1 glutathione S-transferase [Pseudoalteromonas luteoviolacea DSM 6061]